jgi:Nucleotide-diphospho-sugar transferase
MRTRYFCSHLNRGYLAKALALYESLQRHHADARLFLLCLDDDSYDILARLALSRLELVRHHEFEDDALRAARSNRSEREYCYTCSASFPYWLLQHRPEIDLLTFLDADTFFFSDPEPLFAELGGGSVAITEHRFPEMWKHHEDCGIYNSGFASFRRDPNGLACVQWWHESCLAWCHDWIDGDRYSDQKYLEQWPRRFGGVVVLRHKGANVAPWNVPVYRIHQDQGQAAGVMVDDQPLVFYHFCGVRKPAPGLYNSSVDTPMSRALRRQVYGPYVAALHRWQRRIDRVAGTSLPAKIRRLFPAPRTTFRDLKAGEKLLLAPWGRVL